MVELPKRVGSHSARNSDVLLGGGQVTPPINACDGTGAALLCGYWLAAVTADNVDKPGSYKFGKTVYAVRSYWQSIMPSVNTRLSVSGEQRFALLMIVLSVAIFIAIWRAEKGNET